MPILQFKGKTAVENHHYTVPHHTLEFDRKLSVLPKGEDPNLEGNLIIEGDNLLALKALLPTHTGKIKCIYIDPPYNTGEEGWVYNDNLTQPQFKEWIGQVVGKEEEDACRHDKWCCMMYPRLKLLKELLREDGAIFISIDDNELPSLRMVMDEVFGGENFVAIIIWQKNFSPRNSAKWFSEDHEYIVVFAKQKQIWRPILLDRSEDQAGMYSNPDEDPRGMWASGDLSARNPYSKGIYAVKCPGGRQLSGPPPGTYWRVEESRLWELDRDNRIWWGDDRNGVPRLKRFLSEVREGIVPRTIWLHTEAGNTQEAKKGLQEVVPVQEQVFQTPKPTKLIRRILEIASIDGDTILDSFAGSGTTAQAVLEVNKQDGGNRRFILIQQPYDSKENEQEKFNICQKITTERVRRVIQGYPYTGTKRETLLEKRLSLSSLKNAGEILTEVEQAKTEAESKYDEIKAECKDGVVRVIGTRNVKEKTEGLGGSFTYARLSPKPLLGDYADVGKHLPDYVELAKYIWYTETSREWNLKGLNKKTGKIGKLQGRSYFLLYRPNHKEDWAIDMEFLKTTAREDPNRELVVYCEKIWLHRSDLADWEREHKKSVRTMIVPFNLR